MELIVTDGWIEQWRNKQAYWYEGAPEHDVCILVAYDDDHEYLVRCRLDGTVCTVGMAMRESASGEEWGMAGTFERDVEIGSAGAHEGIGFWGEEMASEWLASQGVEPGCDGGERRSYYFGY